MSDSSKRAVSGRQAWRIVAGFGFDHTHKCSQRERWGSGLEGLAPPPPCGQLTRCFSAVAELLINFDTVTACSLPDRKHYECLSITVYHRKAANKHFKI